MSNLVKIMDGFAKDEDGNYHILPMRIEGDLISSPSSNRLATRNYIKHKFIPIEPLKELCTSPQENLTKKRKIDRLEIPVRKELFKVPDKTNAKRLSHNKHLIRNNRTRKSISFKKIISPMLTKKGIVSNKDDLLESRQVDIDKEGLLPTSSSKNNLQKILFPLNKENSNLLINKTPDRKIKTPNNIGSANSDSEFLHLEQQLASAKKLSKTNASPMTSVCTLLEKTKITDYSKKGSQEFYITSLIQQDIEQFKSFRKSFEVFNQQFELFKEQYNLLSQQFLTFQNEHTERSTTLLQLLAQKKDNRENIRKSLRLAEKTKMIISPAIVKKVDLRKSTLNKNVSKIFNDSPRTRNAVNMYNSFRSDCPSLRTPKMDKMGSPTGTKTLSNKIHTQCLLLQDTPK